MTGEILRTNIERSVQVHTRLLENCMPAMTAAANALVSAYASGHKALFFGNGGSSTDAQHLAGEFLGRYLLERRPLPAVALADNTAGVTAIANDFGYAHIFSRQIEALAAPGDVAVAISTSGNSQNIVEGVMRARGLGLFTIGMTGSSGGRLRGLVDALIAVPSDETPRIQECHILIGHALCDAVEQAIAAVQTNSASSR